MRIGKKNRISREVFIAWYDEYVDQIFRFLYLKTSSKEEAEDITSNVFLKLWNYSQENHVDKKTVKAFLYRIARNTLIDYYRKNSREDSISLDGLEKDPDALNVKSHHDSVQLSYDVGQLKSQLSKLKDEYRDLIVMRYVEEMSITEIAKSLEKSNGSVRVSIHRATQSFKNIISEENNEQGI